MYSVEPGTLNAAAVLVLGSSSGRLETARLLARTVAVPSVSSVSAGEMSAATAAFTKVKDVVLGTVAIVHVPLATVSASLESTIPEIVTSSPASKP